MYSLLVREYSWFLLVMLVCSLLRWYWPAGICTGREELRIQGTLQSILYVHIHYSCSVNSSGSPLSLPSSPPPLPSQQNDVYMPYAAWLVETDKFDEAQEGELHIIVWYLISHTSSCHSTSNWPTLATYSKIRQTQLLARTIWTVLHTPPPPIHTFTALNKAGRQSEAVHLLEQLSENAVKESRSVHRTTVRTSLSPAFLFAPPPTSCTTPDRV